MQTQSRTQIRNELARRIRAFRLASDRFKYHYYREKALFCFKTQKYNMVFGLGKLRKANHKNKSKQ